MNLFDEAGTYPIIVLEEEGVFGIIVNDEAFFQEIVYYKDGYRYTTFMEKGF